MARKILAVDDSKLMHKMYEVMLREFSLIRALDGQEALQRLQDHPDIGLVLLDINMPNMDGLDFLTCMKADLAFAPIPVIIISTEGSREDALRGLEAGAAAYISKPFQSEQILDVITRVEKGVPA